LEYSVQHRNGEFYIRTNKRNKDFEIMVAPVGNPGQRNWKPLIPAQPKSTITGMQVFKDYLVYSKRENGLPSLTVYDFATLNPRNIPSSESMYSIGFGANAEFDSTQFKYSYSSPTTSASVFEMDLTKMKSKLLKQTEVLGGYDPKLYAVERVVATAPDGSINGRQAATRVFSMAMDPMEPRHPLDSTPTSSACWIGASFGPPRRFVAGPIWASLGMMMARC
jgi:oligopeptidase B